MKNKVVKFPTKNKINSVKIFFNNLITLYEMNGYKRHVIIKHLKNVFDPSQKIKGQNIFYNRIPTPKGCVIYPTYDREIYTIDVIMNFVKNNELSDFNVEKTIEKLEKTMVA